MEDIFLSRKTMTTCNPLPGMWDVAKFIMWTSSVRSQTLRTGCKIFITVSSGHHGDEFDCSKRCLLLKERWWNTYWRSLGRRHTGGHSLILRTTSWSRQRLIAGSCLAGLWRCTPLLIYFAHVHLFNEPVHKVRVRIRLDYLFPWKTICLLWS